MRVPRGLQGSRGRCGGGPGAVPGARRRGEDSGAQPGRGGGGDRGGEAQAEGTQSWKGGVPTHTCLEPLHLIIFVGVFRLRCAVSKTVFVYS